MGQDHNGVTDQKTAEGDAVIDIGAGPKTCIGFKRRNEPDHLDHLSHGPNGPNSNESLE